MKRGSLFGVWALACGLGFVFACSHPKAPEPLRPTVETKPSASESSRENSCVRGGDKVVSPEILEALSLLATNTPRANDAPAVTEATLGKYIDTLVDDERFAHDVAPQMLVPHLIEYVGSLEFPMVLTSEIVSGTPVYHVPPKPSCTLAAAVDVHPWWAPETTIKVCPDSYQPTHLKNPKKGVFCGNSAFDTYCGCGPKLAFCARDNKQKRELLKSMKEEASAIVVRTVKDDAPIDRIWTDNETTRDRNVEFVYRRWRINAGESPEILDDLDKWPTTPVLAPRYEVTPRQHAGLLTVAGVFGIETFLRPRMKWFYQALWCDEPPAGTVSTEAVLSLKAGDVHNGAGWQELAHRPVCTECHARLDYGGQFFGGYGISVAYEPKDHLKGEGKLFAWNIDDYRGTASLDPKSFGELVVAQPEFGACVVKNVKRRVLDDVWDTTYDQALQHAFRDSKRSLKATMRVALHAYADRRLNQACNAPTPKNADSLEAEVGKYCKTCHGAKRAPDFADLSDKKTLKLALAAVAFGKMPRSPVVLPSDQRHHLTDLLIDRIWTDDAERVEAREYFVNSRPAPVHSIPGVLKAINLRAGHDGTTRFVDGEDLDESVSRGDLLRYSPGVESIVSLEALAACKATGQQGSALEACLTRSTSLDHTARSETNK